MVGMSLTYLPLTTLSRCCARSAITSRRVFFRHISSNATQAKVKIQVPLFLRPPIYTATISDVKKWQKWAKDLAISVGSKFVDVDNGPDTHLLCRELNWLLEDVSPSSTSVGLLDSDENENGERLLSLTTEIDELYVLWKQRIEERRPFQYIVGCEHWRDLVLSVQQGVLIPRPETERIVDLVEEFLLEDKVGRMKEGLWADLGTGSGALSVAIGRILGSRGSVIATDLSPIAASVAEFNVRRYGLQDKVEIKMGSWFEPLKDVKGEVVGLVSNPPYIPSEQIVGLQAEVGRHEPRLALDGGEGGMNDLLHLCEGAASVLSPGGFFVFETNGEKQSMFLVDFMNKKTKGRYQCVKLVSDFAGVKRFVTGICK